ncbi:putative methyl-accepting chemotaxis sensory transducer [Mycobacteroides abscessus subsp. abscessus]|nr:putative methyl-accepting chemotaxis sensory transducer [Mycobacteroides abscessus subsp. abscessus]
MAPATASVATAAAVATPVATLPSQVAAAAARDFERLRNESGDLQMVKRLAWQLLAAGESGRSFALWAVGVMYSATGQRQVVAVSHHGAGYVPPGIAVPTELRMAWADPIINDAFRQRWTGNLDPAATLVAYAELKAGEAAAWRLV